MKKSSFKKLFRRIQKFFFTEQWSLLVCRLDGTIVTLIQPPSGCIWADPFPVKSDGHTYIFIEQQYNRKNGTLGFIELYADLMYSDFKPILEKPYHLSYPNVFMHEGVWYMIPETHENGSIDLYRATDFPAKWVFDSTMISGVEAVDTSILFHDNLWWLCTSLSGTGLGLNRSLSIYYSSTFPSTDWTSHSENPVVLDPGNSRMAGAIYRDAETGNLVRPAQSCIKEYGEHLVLNRIVELTKTSYHEEKIRMIYPEKYLKAVCTHTWNLSGKYLVRDIKTRRLKI